MKHIWGLPVDAPTPIGVAANPADHLRYRADIDGLRAIAVVPVVLFHSGFSAFSGGFVGVDVFFVISGFLITSLLMSELDAGKFSLLGFYERRIRRIFPALFAIMGVCSLAAWFLMMPEEFAYFGRSMVAAALFGSNVLFWDERGYFDTAAQLKPLLHTWSLAVEEQFYIIFPLLLALLYKLRRSRLVVVIAALALLSFALNVLTVGRAPEFAFYMSPPRFWELLVGALLALGAVPSLESRLLNVVLGLFGLGLIGFAVFFYSEGMAFPGFAALAPCLGAALIIYSGSQGGPVARILSAGPIVFLGLISYSLYLWHWPIGVFTRYFFGTDLSTAQAILVISLSLVLSALSWRWIEQPFRRRPSAVTRPALMRYAVAAMSASVAFGVMISAYDGVPSRLPAEAMTVYAAKWDHSPYDDVRCFVDGGSTLSVEDIENGRLCTLPPGTQGRPPSFIVWGDSHASAMAPGIGEAALAAGRSGIVGGAGSCPPVIDFDTGGSKREKVAQCQSTNRAVLDYIVAERIPLVFLVARWPKYVHRAEYGNEGVFFDPAQPIPLADYSAPLRASLDATLAELARNGIKTVIVMDVPEIGYDVPHALAKAVLTHSSADIAPTRDAVRRRQALAMKVLSDSAAKYDAALVDPTSQFCDAERCAVVKNGIVLYRDEDHLSQAGAKSLGHIFDFAFANGGAALSRR